MSSSGTGMRVTNIIFPGLYTSYDELRCDLRSVEMENNF